ncbi:MAG: hypothetical protein UV73_C0013G0016 [Candidatus Gottesmanbacteria bacterium GW2011_GWA2_43_14]|uniref:Uncharacterized protein n=1 Tax=Candidatus Gottesmanbacteria bacterium GW2011_GWA2_43_14 TaxID=1618443 RepID=A0A0G1FLE7_9BACT|nr:MAG: hypothetical protein UV73_C0013G0016 [Candidatus Gottesmanbacteria bacterium GW2011_GWA2_43_14]
MRGGKILLFRFLRSHYFVLLLSLLFTGYFLSPLFYSLVTTPPETVNLLVGHYYEDYFEYLSFVAQGKAGSLFISNLFTNNDPGRYFPVWWPYSLIGFLPYLFRLNIPSPFLYWTASFILIVLSAITAFKLIGFVIDNKSRNAKLAAFILFLTSCGFYVFKGGKIIQLDFWYSNGFPVSKFNMGTPHHQLSQLIFLWLILAVISLIEKKFTHKTACIYILLVILLTLLSPVLLLLFSLALVPAIVLRPGKITRKDLFYFLPPLASTALSLIIFKNTFLASVFVAGKQWDIDHLFYPSSLQFIKAIGPLLILSPFALKGYLSKVSFGRIFLLSAGIISAFFILIPFPDSQNNILKFAGFHNLRFQTLSFYILLSVMAAEIISLVRNRLLFWACITAFFIFALPVFINSWSQTSGNLLGASYLNLMPKDLYEGMRYLKKQNLGVVLTSAKSGLGLVVPALSLQRVYFGRSIFTPSINIRLDTVNKFYGLEMTASEAQGFLKRESITYVVLSNLDLNEKEVFERYPFMSLIFTNGEIRIFKTGT